MASPPASESEKLELLSNTNFDSERNSSEMLLLFDQFRLCLHQFKSCLDLFQQQTALNFPLLSEPFAAEDLGKQAVILAQFYPEELVKFPTEIVKFLESSARSLPSGLRVQLTQALILLINRKIIGIAETLEVFMELQTLGDTVLQQLAFSHVTQSIKNDPNNKALQNILFGILQQEDAAKAKRALITLCDLHQRKVWSDDRTANAICMACFHPSSRIMIAALSFLLDFEIQDDDSDNEDDLATPQPQLVLNKEAMYKIQNEDSDNEDDQATPQTQIVLNTEAMYKASHKGTTSRKKKKAKLLRIARSMKNQQQLSSEKSNTNYCSPLNHLEDAQEFSEKLLSRLQSSSNERLEVKMMMIKVIARTVGLHHLILLDLYPYLQKYVQPHERDVKTLLTAAVQACHKMVPPSAVESLFKQIIDQFVHDQTRPEVITAGLNVVREICLRMPLLITEELLQDLVLYTKSHERAVSVSALSLLTLLIDLNAAANISLGTLKNLVNTAISGSSSINDGVGAIGIFKASMRVSVPYSARWCESALMLKKKEKVAFKRAGFYDPGYLTWDTLRKKGPKILLKLQKERKKEWKKAKIARTRRQKMKQQCSGNNPM